MSEGNILIAEDLAALREPLALALRHAGYEVVTADNGVQALDLVRKERPHLILLDMAMPEMDGIACLRALRKEFSQEELPVIILTAHSELPLVQEAVQLGVSDYYLKASFSLSVLFEKVKRALSGKQLRIQEVSEGQEGHSSKGVVHPTVNVGDAMRPALSGARMVSGHESKTSLAPLLPRTELEARLKRFSEVKGFSPAITNLLRTIESPTSSLDQIVESGGTDQALATRFLWLANSAAFSRGAPVTSLRKAVVRIGTEKLREAALTVAVLDRFGSGETESIHYGRFWEHSVTVASIAAELVRSSPRTQDLEPDVAFTTGLVHDIGRLILIEQLGEVYDQVFKQARASRISLHEAETKLLQTSHAQVAEGPLRKWRFSSQMIRPIMLHHQSLEAVRSLRSPDHLMTSVLVLANNLSQAFLLGDSGEDAIEPVQLLLADLGLDTDALSDLQRNVLESWRDLRTVVVMKSWRDWPERIQLLRDRLGESIRPRYWELGESPLVSTLFERLLRPVSDSAVNSWILHAGSVSHARYLLEEVSEWERGHDLKELPALLLMPSEIELTWKPDRQLRILKPPYCIDAAVETLRELLDGGE